MLKAKWDFKVNLGALHTLFREGEIDIVELGKRLHALLDPIAKADPELGEDLLDPMDELLLLDDGSEEDDYNAILQDLYDIGDAGKRIWFEPD
jgi:hypothetical protein